MRRRSAAPDALVSSTPSMVTDPWLGPMSPASILSVVVLPAPFGPSSATISEQWTVSETLSTTVRVPKRLDRAVATITRPCYTGRPRVTGGGVRPRQYAAVSRIAASTSAAWGRIASSRSGQ